MLTLRTNGVAGGLISAAWFNDYYNLLTGVMTDQPVTIHNHLTLSGTSNHIMFSGQLGKSSDGDIMDASITDNIYFKTATSSGIFTLQFPNGTNSMRFISNAIEVPQWLGIRKIGGTKLAEFKGDSNFIIGGSQYQTTGGSISTTTGQSMDSFDVGEVFECDQEYPKGTILCPGLDDKLVQCTHDNCHAAMVVSPNPGLGLGVPDTAKGHNYIAIAGRVNCRTSSEVTPKQLVVSDGKGGVRPVNYGEPAFVIGFALNSSLDGRVGVFLRSIFVMLKPAS